MTYLKPTLLAFLIAAAFSYAQQNQKLDPESLKKITDSLKTLRHNLLFQQKNFKSEVESLKVHSNKLTEQIGEANLEIEKLYTNKFGKETGRRIFNKQIWKGMTEKMLLASWGKPDKIDKNVEKWGVFTQWYYGNVTFFFRDGKLTDWEEKK